MKSFPLAIIVILLVLCAGVAVIWTSTTMEREVSRRVGSSLETVGNTTHEALRIWQERTTASAAFIANLPEIHEAVERQVRLPHDRRSLSHSEALQALRQFLGPY